MNPPVLHKPRIGFLGVGWIGHNRLSALLESECAEVVGIVEPVAEMRERAQGLARHAAVCSSLEELLALRPDGVVISTPSALHASQCVAALKQRVAVFCQKPLARNAAETMEVVSAAQAANRLLAVDFSYRHTRACQAIKSVIDSGELGRIYAARLVFHNAYGPDKPWYLDRAQSGGGCLVDLGIHLVDLALWLLSDPVTRVHGYLYAQGKRLAQPQREVEDYASAVLELQSGATVEIACSWRLHAGCDAVIEGSVYGTQGGARFHNVRGSFYDFSAERMHGTKQELLIEPPDPWGGRAIVAWAARLRESNAFDPQALELVTVARLLDAIVEAAR
jgi:predicted dehydrogenase